MKSDRDHDVPLVDKAVAIIEEHTSADPKAELFPLSNGSMLALIRRMNKQRKAAGLPQWVDPKLNNRAVTPHGFRSSFKDWSRDVAHFPDELSEAALAHAIEDKTKGAYARGTMFEKRRHVMEAWLSFIDGGISSDVVVPERAAS
jgi:integrase